jgi:hypothetical protein
MHNQTAASILLNGCLLNIIGCVYEKRPMTIPESVDGSGLERKSWEWCNYFAIPILILLSWHRNKKSCLRIMLKF